jgi:hypothetical protein
MRYRLNRCQLESLAARLASFSWTLADLEHIRACESEPSDSAGVQEALDAIGSLGYDTPASEEIYKRTSDYALDAFIESEAHYRRVLGHPEWVIDECSYIHRALAGLPRGQAIELHRDFNDQMCVAPDAIPLGGWVRDLTTEGVHPNPGPRNAVIVLKNGGRGAARKRRPRRPIGRRRGARNRKPSVQRPRLADVGTQLTTDYVKTLSDPFQYPGVKLGWGCMTSTSLVQAYTRGITAANADGSLALLLYPNVQIIIDVANAGAAVSFTTAAMNIGAADYQAIEANYSAARVVSGGIRSKPLIAMTSIPGQAYSGALTATPVVQLALTPTDLASTNTTQVGSAYGGVGATLRPYQPSSFDFHEEVVGTSQDWNSGANANEVIPYTLAYNVFLGLPASANVEFEAVLNLECLPLEKHNGANVIALGNDRSPTLADYWPSFEKLWKYVRNVLPPSAMEDGSLARMAAYTAGRFIRNNMPRSSVLRIMNEGGSSLGEYEEVKYNV